MQSKYVFFFLKKKGLIGRERQQTECSELLSGQKVKLIIKLREGFSVSFSLRAR